MWSTNDGVRTLDPAEARLVRRAIRSMVDDRLVNLREQTLPDPYGIDWFDQWDVEQQLWLLEQIVISLFTTQPPPSPAAIWEATIDAIFTELLAQIELELDHVSSSIDEPSWRQLAIDAISSRRDGPVKIDPDDSQAQTWQRLLTQIADGILGVPGYQKAEMFRDGDVRRAAQFLERRGLPEDFLQRLPPNRTAGQAEQSVARIMSTLNC